MEELSPESGMSPESRHRCEAALAYIEDMSEWYDEEVEGAPKLEYARKILKEIDRRGELTPAERAWCEQHIESRYGATAR